METIPMSRLDAWPALKQWHERLRLAPPAHAQSGEHLAWSLCRALACDSPASTEALLAALRRFVTDASQPLGAFMEAIHVFEQAGADLMNLLADLATDALQAGRGGELSRLLHTAAEHTGLIGLRFLSAWTALNDGDLSGCVEQCEKIDGAYASVYTLQGQALLELGEVSEATRILEIATQLGPREILAWFQLAKAYQVVDRTADAWRALERCQSLAPQSAEIALFMVMVSLNSDATRTMRRAAFEDLSARLSELPDRSEAVLHLLRLAGRLEDRQAARELARDLQGAGLRRDPRRMTMVAEVLRTYEKLGWMDVSATLLTGILDGT
jgi:tetratricopeptide (TPR) repeat protein